MPRPLCLHCREREADGNRGLCRKCYDKPGVRELYPRRQEEYREATAEELDRLIAERMADLPAWWQRSEQRMRAGDEDE